MRALLLLCSVGVLATCSRPPSLMDEILALGELRVVTRVSPATYYSGPNGPLGPEYELVRGFADKLGVRLSLRVVDRFADLIPAIRHGEAHLAAAGLTVTAERAEQVDFGPSYQRVEQQLVYKRGRPKPRRPDDLVGKRVVVVAGSSYAEHLRGLQDANPDVTFTENPTADVSDLLLAVAAGKIDHTVVDSNLFRVYRNMAPEIRPGFELSADDELAWALPKRHDPSLALAIANYYASMTNNGTLARIQDRYYGHTKRFDYVGTRRFMRDARSKLPFYRALFQNAADATGADWRLLAAIGYQESRWDPEATSPTGVRGIMMLTENTASVLGVDDRIDPVQSIVGGADYLARMKQRFRQFDIQEPDLTWFALAAYNVGYAHVQDARKLTREQGRDARLWVQVRDDLEKLAQRRWYQRTEHGYAPGWEPVRYVENVRNYFDILRWMSRDPTAPLPPARPSITLTSNTAPPATDIGLN